MKPDPNAARLREERHQAYLATPSIGERFPKAGDFALDLRFHNPSGTERPTPRRRVFMPSMRAIFEVACPVYGCKDGGFDLGAPIARMLSDRRTPREGVARCEGKRNGQACGVELSFQLTDSGEG